MNKLEIGQNPTCNARHDFDSTVRFFALEWNKHILQAN